MLEHPHVPGPHPDRIGHRPRGGRPVRAGGVAEVAEPLLGAVACLELGVQRGEDVVPHHVGPSVDMAGDLPAGGVVGEREVGLLEPADDRLAARPLPRPAAVEPEAAPVGGRHLLEERDRVDLAHDAPRKLATSCAPCSDRIDSGWNCTPSRGSVRCRTPITTAPAVAEISRLVGHRDRRQRVVAHRREPLGQVGEDAAPVVLDGGHLAVGGQHPLHRAAVRRHQPLHAQADPEHRPGGGQEHLAPDREVGRLVGVAGAGREHDMGVREHVGRRHLVVLHHCRQHAGDAGDQVDEVPGVGVVVVDHHDVRNGRAGHRRSRSPTSSCTRSNPCSVRIDSAWNWMPR